jgi:hypothetical protein
MDTEKFLEVKQELRENIDVADIGFKNGDLHDEDTGEFFCNLTHISDKVEELDKEMKLPPAKLSLYIDGWWYVYAIHGRYKEGEGNDKKEE